MMIYEIVFLVIILRYCVCSERMVIKGIGNDTRHVSYLGFPEGTSTFYDIDLYPNQYINIDLSESSGNLIGRIEPRDDKYFNEITNPLSIVESLRRPDSNIKDIGSIHTITTRNTFKIYYDDLIKPTKITKMYFDFIGKSESKIVGTMQINVMPDIENIEEEQIIIDLGEEKYKGFRSWIYLKEVRYGSKLAIYCKGIDGDDTDTVTYTKYQNPITKIMYDILDNTSNLVSKRQAGLYVDLSADKVYDRNKKTGGRCNTGAFSRIDLKAFYFSKYDGYNRSITDRTFNYDKPGNYIDIKDRKIVSKDLPQVLLNPSNCFNEFIDSFSKVVKTKEYLKGAKVTNITNSIKIIDLTKVSSYNKKILLCKFEGVTSSPDMFLHIDSCRNMTDPDDLDKNKISTTIFVEQENKYSRVFVNEGIRVRDNSEGEYLYYLEGEEKVTLESPFINIPFEGSKSYMTVIQENEVEMSPKYREINHNPVYILLEDRDKVLKNIIRVYIQNVSGEIKDKSTGAITTTNTNMTDLTTIINVPIKSNKIVINCSDIIQDKKVKDPILFPKGKNRIYRNINNVNKHYDEFEKIQFEELFGTKGITILKKPETVYDLEIIIDDDYEIIADHIRPIYFICAAEMPPEQWKRTPQKYAIIAIDPIYKSIKYQGCGNNDEIFDDTNKECKYNLKEDKNVRMHCPDYVPEHFLTGDQEKYKSESTEGDIKNPFIKLIRCYNRSSFFNRLFKPRYEIDILEKRKSVSELRSLWKIDETLMKEQGISSALCVCYDTKGEPKSSINIKL